MFENILGAVSFTLIGAVIGVVFLLISVFIVPKLVNKLTPNIDEGKEIAKGNLAVAHYFGAVVQAVIIGISIIIAAAIIAGISGW